MKEIELIIFDLDGTLIDSKIDLANSVNHALDELNVPEKDTSLIAKYIGGGITNLMKLSLGRDNESELKRAVEIFKTHYGKHLTDNTVLYPHIEEALDYFSKKHKVVITNKTSDYTKAILKKLGVIDRFDIILGAEDVEKRKPSPYPIKKVINILNVSNKKTIIVGDMATDIAAGRNADICTCGVTYGLGAREDLLNAGPDFLINDIRELERIIS